ncbi:MAG: hypothetical protein HW389_1485 [Bacteroidetes bacterium]|nr:hypothetical protein [Bacteroidota bacterium]
MNRLFRVAVVLGLMGFLVSTSAQMIKRSDAVWARIVPPGTITFDGKLDEAAWKVADSVLIAFDSSNTKVIPGSGWKSERSGSSWNGKVTDPTRATVKFLIQGNELIVGIFARDSSVGGGLFNECDGVNMNLRDHTSGSRPAPPYEYGFMWVSETWATNPIADQPGQPPSYFGPAANDRNVYTGYSFVYGVASDDKNGTSVLTPDAGYSMEVRFNLAARGYDISKPQGEILEFSVAVYDADWSWPYNDARFYGNRCWWQGQWGNSDGWNVGRILVRSDVTLATSVLPAIGPDLTIPNAANHPAPVIDGNLTESVWKTAASFRMTYGDTTLRKSYPGIGPWRSGQTQPKLSGATGTPAVIDPGEAVVRYFFKGDTLYVGVDVNDQVVTSINDFDRYDGFRLTITTRDSIELIDHVLLSRALDLRFDAAGNALPMSYLRFLDSTKKARVGVKMKPGTTINDPNDADVGFTMEFAITLTALGYPGGLGDHVLFFGATLFDGDKFTNTADDYGSRTWFMREHDRGSAPAWCYMDPNTIVTGVVTTPIRLPGEFVLHGNYPNPFNPSTTIEYSTPREGFVTLQVYDVLGRMVSKTSAGTQSPGTHTIMFNAGTLSSGVYYYRLQLVGDDSRSPITMPFAKMMFVK